MRRIKWLLVGLLALPALELIGFFLIAALIGWIWAGLLLIASSFVGVRLLRKFGKRDFERIRAGIAYEGLAAVQLHEPAVARIAGALLLTMPGFITGALGTALFVPGFRKRIAAAFEAVAQKRPARGQDRTLDLAPSEWQEETGTTERHDEVSC